MQRLYKLKNFLGQTALLMWKTRTWLY